MFAFAMPPKAWMRPGPETTRHTPGLEEKQSYQQQVKLNSRKKKRGVDARQLSQL